MTQLTLMRELLSVFCGNEMVFGIILACWLLLTGIGTRLGKSAARLRHPLHVLVGAQLFIAVMPIVTTGLARVLPGILFVRGAMIGPLQTAAGCFLLLLPYCLVTGYLLPLACAVLARAPNATSIGQVYFLDCLGDVLGGLAFTFLLVGLLRDFHILYVPAALNVVLALAVAIRLRSLTFAVAGFLVAGALAAGVSLFDLDAVTAAAQYGEDVIFRGKSKYGSVVVTKSSAQYNFFENGAPLFSTGETERVEETVHYAMAQRPQAKHVLLVSGGVSGTAAEILKYNPERLDYVELDPLLVSAALQFIPGGVRDNRIHIVNVDGRLAVRQAKHRYDVVIVDMPDPSTSQINRFYTMEFFREVKAALRPAGVLSFSLGHYENYLSEELRRLIATAHRTVREVFANVLLVPGGEVFFLASDAPLQNDIASAVEAARVPTEFVNPHYLTAALAPDRRAAVQRAISRSAPINTDLNPVLYYYQLRRWLSHFNVTFGFLEAGLLLCLVVYVARLKPVSFAIFTTGFAAAALEIVLLMAFQVLYGYVYGQLGLIVTMFMIGLAAGSFLVNRTTRQYGKRHLARLDLAVAIFAGALPLILMLMSRMPQGPISAVCQHAGIPLLTFLLAILVGMEFPLAARVRFEGVTATAAKLYGADLIGACLGAMLVSTLLIPLIGMTGACALVAVANVASGLVLLRSRTS